MATRDSRPPGGSSDERPLVIRVTAGSGKGRTALAAFDSALRAAGVADHNLVRLSSVIPAKASIEVATASGSTVRTVRVPPAPSSSASSSSSKNSLIWSLGTMLSLNI